MNIYLSIEEKYLKAAQKRDYGNTVKALRLLEEVLEEEPSHAKAHYELAMIYSEEFGNSQQAERHLELALRFDPLLSWTYLSLLEVLNAQQKHARLLEIGELALKHAEVCNACIGLEIGLSFEKKHEYEEALRHYRFAKRESLCARDTEKAKEAIDRIRNKEIDQLPYCFNQ
jgi:tetratricopeptide (TPR) repeat protein